MEYIRARVASARTDMPIAFPPILICLAMLACTSVTDVLGGPSFPSLFVRYLIGAAGFTMTAVTIFILPRLIRLARTDCDHPLALIVADLKAKVPLLLLPLLVAPLFLAGFT